MMELFNALDQLDMVALYKDIKKEDEYYVVYVVKRPFEEGLNVPKKDLDKKALLALIRSEVEFAVAFAGLNARNKEITRTLISALKESEKTNVPYEQE